MLRARAPVPGAFPYTRGESSAMLLLLAVPWEASGCSAPDDCISTKPVLMAIFGVPEQCWSVMRWLHYLQSQEDAEGFPSGLVTSAGRSQRCNILTRCGYSTHSWAASHPTPLCPSPMGNPAVKGRAIPWAKGKLNFAGWKPVTTSGKT